MIQLGLLGWPVSHSLSPNLQNAGLKAVGLEGEYKLFPVDPSQPDKLGELIGKVRSAELLGLNVTIPYKQTVIQYLDELTPTASRIGAVNTIYLRDGHLMGHNTDAQGFEADLRNKSGKIMDIPGNALVLGAGGSARAVVSTLLGLSWSITVAARNLERAQELARSLAYGIEPGKISCTTLDSKGLLPFLDKIIVIVNTTPVGMTPKINYSPWPEGLRFPRGAFVYDLIYNPAKTLLITQAQESGLRGANGLGMLVEQASEGFEIWTGKSAPREVMYQAVGINN